MKCRSSIHLLALQLPLRWRGFSLIELMVAMTIGLLLLAGLFGIYINVAQSARSQAALALMQGNARYAFEIMGVDIRMAGFTGSQQSPTDAVGTLSPITLSSLKDLSNPLIGYKNTNPPNVCTTANTPACYWANPDNDSSTPSPDSLTVVRVDTENKYAVSLHTAGTSFTLSSWPWSDSSPSTAVGQIFVAADYTHTAVFRVGAASDPVVSYSGSLGVFGSGTTALAIYRLSGVSYYIGRNPVGEPALYRDKLVSSTASTKEELVQGVENMQITYGVDTGTDNNVDAYQAADSVTNWSRVLSVRITLTLVSGQNEKVGTTGDKLLRKSFSNTIAIRNRLL